MKEDKVLELLEAADWDRIIRELTLNAIWQARRYPWSSGSHNILPGGKTPGDIAVEAIEKVWNGKRDWDPERYPNLLLHLKWEVRRDIWRLFKSTLHQKTTRFPETSRGSRGPEEPGFPPGEPSDSQTGYDQPSGTLDPESEMIFREQQELEERVKNELYAHIQGDEDLELLLLCFEDGLDKPETIAAQMGWEVTKVYNLKKRLFRKAASLREKIEQDCRQVKGKI